MSSQEPRTPTDTSSQRTRRPLYSDPPLSTWAASEDSSVDNFPTSPLTPTASSESSSVQEFYPRNPIHLSKSESSKSLPICKEFSSTASNGRLVRGTTRSPDLASRVERPNLGRPSRGVSGRSFSDGGPNIDSRVISNSESFRATSCRDFTSSADDRRIDPGTTSNGSSSRGEFDKVSSGPDALSREPIAKNAQFDLENTKRPLSSGSFKGKEFTGGPAPGARLEDLVAGREAQGGSKDFTKTPDSAPFEKPTSFKELDAKDDTANDPVLSTTQTEKSSFLWVPLNHDTVPPAHSPGSLNTNAQGKQLPRYVSPETSYFEKIISPRRDPYLAALDAASGRSFSDRLPPLKSLKTNKDVEKPKHGLPRPPFSVRQSTKSALKPEMNDPKVATMNQAGAPFPPAPEVHIAIRNGEPLQHDDETKERTDEPNPPNTEWSNTKSGSETTTVVVENRDNEPEACQDHPEATCSPATKPHLETRPTMPCQHTTNAEPPKRRTLSFAPSRFKPAPGGISMRTFSRFRGLDETPRSTPRTPKTPSAPGTYDLFKTRSRKFSGPLERQFTRQFTRRLQEDTIDESTANAENGGCNDAQQQEQEDDEGGMIKALSAGRYFDALEGPELEVPKDKENLLLPPDERWPFLLRFPIGCFGVALGLGSQTILWKNLAQSREMAFLHIPIEINLWLWCVALLALVVIFITYFLKIIYYFEAVRREYHHPVRVNFFFAPWIAGMFLTIGVPPVIAKTVHPAVWCVLMSPIVVLELKIYGQWLSGGERRLSKVANPSTHLSVVGNFVGSILGATVGWKEPAIFFWAVGLAHYLVLFVTLYQRLPTNETLPKDLHPVFFLFVAAPSAASVAWMKIIGEFDYVSRLVFFIALFLYTSLIVRINFFRGFKFSISWWAYTFPMTAASIASIQYSHVATSWITKGLALVLSIVSSTTVFTLFCSTLLHAFVWRCLFPNDLAIAITAHKPKFTRKASSDDDGCGLYSLHHSEPLYKSMLDAYHQFLSTREQQELQNCKTDVPNTLLSLSPTESTNGAHENKLEVRSASL